MHVFELRNLRDDSYRCEWCGEKFNTQSALQQHINKEHTPRNNGAGSNETFKYEEFLMNVYDDVRYKCRYCGMLFETESDLEEHIKEWHTGHGNCAGSGETFKYEEYLMKVFLDVVYKCRYCGMTFKTESDLEDHIKQWHTPMPNGDSSGGSFKYNKHGTTCGEPFNVDQNIPLSDSTSCEMFLIFEQLRTILEKFEELNSVKKTYEECFKFLKKSKGEENIKGQGPENKESNEAEQKQGQGGHQEFSPASEEKNF
ncbi:zinc finger protein 724-like isoform X2 [Centruroides sculpturatus]|uniref:zinc finger protein 724-like isoform X2 n=1 Tax=Centruroides sculpturatus TaxID=218467 RepID=UPI000C6CB7B4|nr:zinc finger protein 724-like isoform X2 [Centruroides sculpturatus]